MVGGIALSALVLISLANALLGLHDTSLKSLKAMISTPLGAGGYLAAFLVFLFNIALHRRHWLAGVFAVLALLTFSRVGCAMLGASMVLWAVATFRPSRFSAVLGVFFIGSLGACVGIFAAASRLTDFTEIGSTGIRLMMWRDAIDAIAHHPLIGAPRSWYVEKLNFGYAWDASFGAWNPHNFILATWMLFGAIGVVAFTWFLLVTVRSVAACSATSATWRGILAGLVVFITWGLFEDLLLNAAALILIGTLYGLASKPVTLSITTKNLIAAYGAVALAICFIGGPTMFKPARLMSVEVLTDFGRGWRHFDTASENGDAAYWSDGEWSELKLQFAQPPGNARFAVMTVDSAGYVFPPLKYEQKVSVYLGAHEVSFARLRSAGTCQFRIFIPIGSIDRNSTLSLDFRSWSPTVAREFGIEDDFGPTAFGIKQIHAEYLQ